MQPAATQQVAQQVAQQSGFLGIRLEGWLTLLAVILGPIIALWLPRVSERRREDRSRKLWVFRELMATRVSRLSARHVEALNLIDLEFSQKRGKDRKVLDAWRLYLDSLGNTPTAETLHAATATPHRSRRRQSGRGRSGGGTTRATGRGVAVGKPPARFHSSRCVNARILEASPYAARDICQFNLL